jgi:hypothetical protein
MPSTRGFHFLLLLVLAVALMAGPVPANAICEATGHWDNDPCHTGNDPTSPSTATETGAASADNDCCATGCLYCYLPCCTGTATVLTSALVFSSSGCMQTQPLASGCDLYSVDPDPIYHPPRF